jgi:hypothetical protein
VLRTAVTVANCRCCDPGLTALAVAVVAVVVAAAGA